MPLLAGSCRRVGLRLSCGAPEGADMINGAHILLYTSDADADRAFLRDVLGLAHVDAEHRSVVISTAEPDLCAGLI